MKVKRSQKGFSLLEMLIALTIVAVTATIALPNIMPNSDQEAVERKAIELRSEFQQLTNESWLSGKSYSVQISGHQKWSVMVLSKGEWEKSHAFTTSINNFTYSLEMDRPIELKGKSNNSLVFLSNGEYSPFELEIQKGNNFKTIYGDGINDIQIK